MRISTPRALLALVLVALLSGCIQLPDAGPVSDAGNQGDDVTRLNCCYLPNPPRAGETPSEIVEHFLEAMTATPLQTTVAQQFLTTRARGAWRPESSTIVYGTATIRGQRQVSLTLRDAYFLDARGAFEESKPAQTLVFGMEREDGEWRISGVPDALIVPRTWTDDNFVTANTYYLDPTTRVMVPEPVHLPAGEGFVTALMQSLLAGPNSSAARVERTFIPENLKLGLSVRVDDSGRAEIDLEGDASGMTAEQALLMAAQVSWTLRQDPSLRAIKLTADGRALPGLNSEVSLQTGAELDPAGFGVGDDVYATRAGKVVSGTPGPELGSPTAVPGEFGESDLGPRSLAVDLAGERLAAVSGDGTALLMGSLAPDGAVEQVLSGAGDLLRPAWDMQGRLWLIDRAGRNPLVTVLIDGKNLRVRSQAMHGENVRAFLVARDGSRLVAAVRRGGRDVVLSYRIAYGKVNRSPRLLPPVELHGARSQGTSKIRDLGWRSPTEVAVLSPLRGFTQIRTVLVDGSPPGLQTSPPTLAGNYVRLVSSPEATVPMLAASSQAYVDPFATTRSPRKIDVDTHTMTYPG